MLPYVDSCMSHSLNAEVSTVPNHRGSEKYRVAEYPRNLVFFTVRWPFIAAYLIGPTYEANGMLPDLILTLEICFLSIEKHKDFPNKT